MTPQIKLLFLLIIFSLVAPLRGFADDEAAEMLPKNEEATESEPVSRSTVDEPPAPVRTVQIPVFSNGKWKGYREEALEPERKPASEPAVPESTAPEAPALSETATPPSPAAGEDAKPPSQ